MHVFGSYLLLRNSYITGDFDDWDAGVRFPAYTTNVLIHGVTDLLWGPLSALGALFQG
jgi:hypothetical protein